MPKKFKTYIIAEAGVNHNGSFAYAKKLISLAKECGADAVKFQIYKTENLAHELAKKAPYQVNKYESNNQFQMLKKYELDYIKFKKLYNYANEKKIDFLATPMDLESLKFYLTLKTKYIKISSGDINFYPLLLESGKSKKKIILSTGMSRINDIINALSFISFGRNQKKSPSSYLEVINFVKKISLEKILKNKVILLHCTSSYPVPFEDINLNAMEELKQKFNFEIGYSDHSKSILVPCLAVAKGARIIEKHITLNNDMIGPDHNASFAKKEFKKMVDAIRTTELVLGVRKKKITKSESLNLPIARRYIYAKHDIKKGDVINFENMSFLRPRNSNRKTNPLKILGKYIKKDLKKGEQI